MSIYIEAPDEWPAEGDQTSVFLAGGITGCENWQARVVSLLLNTNLILFNPRRANFSVSNPWVTAEQIMWEWRYLRQADRIMFWFPASEVSVCPIALYELGAWSMTDKRIAVGVEPGYTRAEDVRVQTALTRPDIAVCSSLEDLVEAIK